MRWFWGRTWAQICAAGYLTTYSKTRPNAVRLLVTRPQPDADRFADALAEIGVDALVAPLMSIELNRAIDPDLSGCTALAFTSANGARAFSQLSNIRDLPAYTVGSGSARAAAELGFSIAGKGAGTVESLADVLSATEEAGARIYHAAGADIAGDLAALLEAKGVACRRQVLYKAQIPAVLPEEINLALSAGGVDGAVFFSPRSASTFVRLVTNAGQASACAGLDLYSLSPAVTEAACGTIAWRRVREARTPMQEALINTIRAEIPDGNAG
jgi:uroporphyrinogen-III synthase